jgi:hypothetical protein
MNTVAEFVALEQLGYPPRLTRSDLETKANEIRKANPPLCDLKYWLQETDDAELALAKLRSLLARAVTDVEQALRYYGAVLSIPACSGYEPADLGSPSERERAFQVFIDALLAASRNRPILIIVEDVQWTDPTTIELHLREADELVRVLN